VAVEERSECREANSSRTPPLSKEKEREEEAETEVLSSLPLPTWATRSRGSTTCSSSMAVEATAKGVMRAATPSLLQLVVVVVGGQDHTSASRVAQDLAKPRAFFKKV